MALTLLCSTDSRCSFMVLIHCLTRIFPDSSYQWHTIQNNLKTVGKLLFNGIKIVLKGKIEARFLFVVYY